MAEGDARDDASGQAGRNIAAYDQGVATNRAGVLLEPGIVVSRLLSGFGCWWLTLRQQFAAAGVGSGFRTGIETIMPDGLRVGGREVLEIPPQKLGDRQRVALVALACTGVRIVRAPLKADLAVVRFIEPMLAQGIGFQVS